MTANHSVQLVWRHLTISSPALLRTLHPDPAPWAPLVALSSSIPHLQPHTLPCHFLSCIHFLTLINWWMRSCRSSTSSHTWNFATTPLIGLTRSIWFEYDLSSIWSDESEMLRETHMIWRAYDLTSQKFNSMRLCLSRNRWCDATTSCLSVVWEDGGGSCRVWLPSFLLNSNLRCSRFCSLDYSTIPWSRILLYWLQYFLHTGYIIFSNT